jgi:hypothetical protein
MFVAEDRSGRLKSDAEDKSSLRPHGAVRQDGVNAADAVGQLCGAHVHGDAGERQGFLSA